MDIEKLIQERIAKLGPIDRATVMRDAWLRYREIVKWEGLPFRPAVFAWSLRAAWECQITGRDPEYIRKDLEREKEWPRIAEAMARMRF